MSFSFSKKKKPTPKGKLIVIDGTDSSGKTTQAQMLSDELALNGRQTEYIHFPQYGEKSGGMVENYLEGKYGEVNSYAASIFYAADRFDASFKIRQWLKEGKMVICDRYVTANAAHQGGNLALPQERVKFFKWLDHLEYGIFNIPKPDLTIVLHMPTKFTMELMRNRQKNSGVKLKGKKGDLLEENFKRVISAEKIYMEISELFPYTKVVECANAHAPFSPLEIHNKVWELVRRIALKDSNLR